MKVELLQRASVGAKVIRKDGSTTDLGVIAETPTAAIGKLERLKRWWKQCLKQ